MARIRVEENDTEVKGKPVETEAKTPILEPQPTVIEDTEPVPPPKRLTKKQIALIVGFITLIIIVLLVGKLLSDKRKLEQKVANLSTNQAQADDENKKLDTEVRQIYDITDPGAPTIVNVADAEKARASQPFFERAQNGDKVLLYTGQKIAIIYRPSTKKIINSVAISSDNPDQSTTPGTAQQPANNKTTR